MLRILLLVLVGFIVATAALRTIASVVVFVVDMKNGGQRAPEILGVMTGSFVIALGLGWVWRKIYFFKKSDSAPNKPGMNRGHR